MIIAMAAPSGQFADRVKKPWIVLPYMIPSVPPTSDGVTYSPTVGMKTRKNVARTPGRLSGIGHAPQARPRPRSQVGGCLQLVAIDALHRRVDRQRHVWIYT